MKSIKISCKGNTYSIPNAWECLPPNLYTKLVADILLMSQGKLSPAMLKVNFVCNAMGWVPGRIKGESALANVAMLAEQVDFILSIAYPDNDAALVDLDEKTRRIFKKKDPAKVLGNTMAQYLRRLDYRYCIDDCWCAQLIPFVQLKKRFKKDVILKGYAVNTSFGVLSCSLTALQYVEARNLLGNADSLPLLASILYSDPNTKYSSSFAHQRATEFRELPKEVLYGIMLNFRSFNNFLFSKTEFSLLTASRLEDKKLISTGALESLYNLSSDGYGSASEVEQMNVIQYLTILRKKIIESVRSMHTHDMSLADIEKETGLPITLIKQII